jgi:hypothetical protein
MELACQGGFRVQAVTRTGAENWSQIVSLLVK